MSGIDTAASELPCRRGRWRLSHVGWVWFGLALIIGVVGWWKSFPVVLMLSYTMVGLLLVQVPGLWRRQAGWGAQLMSIPPLFAGERFAVKILVDNRSRLTGRCLVDLENEQGTTLLRWYLEGVPAQQQRWLTGMLALPRRGRYHLRVCIRESDAFGWFERYTSGNDQVVVVLPALGHIDVPALQQWLERQAGNGEIPLQHGMRRLVTEPVDVRGIRSYRPGDPWRAIHWRSTARRRRLMVKEYDAAYLPPLLLTLVPPSQPFSSSHVEKWEAALSFATTLAYYWPQSSHVPLLLVVVRQSGPPLILSIAPSGWGVRQALVPLADPESSTAADLPRFYSQIPGRWLHLLLATDAATMDPASLPLTMPGQLVVPLQLEKLPWWYTPAVLSVTLPGTERSTTTLQAQP
ncbi:MAG: DUF58 domain-containing protein [Gemmataceae bacterium]|nr:DUF58 domain-containing protein [Gemmataceae bacterium]MCS7270503.1 DUF58 domain-containing protein [Gemmataceae bacterium]MDW8243483.1 DUF58 domain-containing protein [Thermogemmata sp.]